MTGFFVTIDGPGGTGKTTIVAALARQLREVGDEVHATTEPSASELGRTTRRLADQVHGTALALLVAADRQHHLATEIRPHLAAGHTVVCDRYLASSLVLQRLDGVPLDFIRSINAGVTPPDLAVILTAPAETITARLAARGSHHRFEDDPDNVHREVELYEQAVRILEEAFVPVLRLDTHVLTPEGAASAIRRAMGSSTTTVASDNRSPTPDSDP